MTKYDFNANAKSIDNVVAKTTSVEPTTPFGVEPESNVMFHFDIDPLMLCMDDVETPKRHLIKISLAGDDGTPVHVIQNCRMVNLISGCYHDDNAIAIKVIKHSERYIVLSIQNKNINRECITRITLNYGRNRSLTFNFDIHWCWAHDIVDEEIKNEKQMNDEEFEEYRDYNSEYWDDYDYIYSARFDSCALCLLNSFNDDKIYMNAHDHFFPLSYIALDADRISFKLTSEYDTGWEEQMSNNVYDGTVATNESKTNKKVNYVRAMAIKYRQFDVPWWDWTNIELIQLPNVKS